MIIQPQDKFITAEEQSALYENSQQLKILNIALENLYEEYAVEKTNNLEYDVPETQLEKWERLIKEKGSFNKKYFKILDAIKANQEKRHEIYRAIDRRYIDSFNGDIKAITEELQRIVDAITKDDFVKQVTSAKNLLILARGGEYKPTAEENKRYSRNYANCRMFIEWVAALPLQALKEAGAIDEGEQIIDNKAALYYKRPKTYKATAAPLPPPEPIYENDMYGYILQGKLTNTLARTGTKQLKVNEWVGNSTATAEMGDVTITLTNFTTDIKLSRTAQKVLDMLTMKLSYQLPTGANIDETGIGNKRIVSVTVDEYMQLFGLNDRKNARQQLKEALDAIYGISVKGTDTFIITPKGKKKPYKEKLNVEFRIASAKASLEKRGIVSFSFSPECALYLSKRFPMPYPKALFKTNTRLNPHAYNLGRRICEHYNMNIADSNSNIIAVKSLVESCPELPTYNDVMNSSKHISKLIITPFERDMDALTGIAIKHWEYCNSQGTPLTDEQLQIMDYETFISLNIHFEMLDEYPDQTSRIIEIQERKERKRKQPQKAV